MKKSEIERFIAKQAEISRRNYMNYQESGTTRYLRAYEKAEDLIGLARQALNAADDHEENGFYRFYVGQWGNTAIRVLHHKDMESEEAVQLLKDIKAIALLKRLSTDPWGRDAE